MVKLNCIFLSVLCIIAMEKRLAQSGPLISSMNGLTDLTNRMTYCLTDSCGHCLHSSLPHSLPLLVYLLQSFGGLFFVK